MANASCQIIRSSSVHESRVLYVLLIGSGLLSKVAIFVEVFYCEVITCDIEYGSLRLMVLNLAN